jgi:drug/metabolite transporter (DMT)-like permease
VTTTWFAIIIVALATLFSGFGPVFMKKGAAKFTLNPVKIFRKPSLLFKNYGVILGCLFFAVSSIMFVIGLKYGELSVLYPLTSLTYIWTCLLSTKMLKEKMSRGKWFGIACIIIGVVLIGLGRAQ